MNTIGIIEAHAIHNVKLRLHCCLLSSEPWGERGTRTNVGPSKMVCSLMCHSVHSSKFNYRTTNRWEITLKIGCFLQSNYVFSQEKHKRNGLEMLMP